MINKILIANRGEIAVRIIRTAKSLGIKTVAIYSEIDKNSLHVSMADESVFVGASPSSQSYLNVKNVIKAIKNTGADAVHPGYGFLSENADFIEELEKIGVTFIGPSSSSVRSMGDKITSKKIAIEAGVNTVPGYMGEVSSVKEAKKIAKDIGYPVMIKATAGGGGKGMRVVRSEAEVESAYNSSTNEAKKSFGDDRIFVEKFIENPRHIEIQLLGDKFGNYVCLGERECSIQRHNQKVIEEAPSPFLDEKTRQKMYEQTIKLGKKVKYYSAGTVEYIMDQNRNFYFLEMNTRLQVEHPVTELITGLDIVKEMINIADGHKLEKKQSDIKINGWAIESRIYAEDPSLGFLPSSGRINEYKQPEIGNGVRIDTGIYEGAEVSMFYDAMIAKLCTYGQTRDEAIHLMQEALGDYIISGVSNNITFLQAIMKNDNFIKGNLSTNFIAKEYPTGFSGASIDTEMKLNFIATTIFAHMIEQKRNIEITGRLANRKKNIEGRWVVFVNDESFAVYVREAKDGFSIECDNDIFDISSSWTLGDQLFRAIIVGKKVSLQIKRVGTDYLMTCQGSTAVTKVVPVRVAELLKYMPKVDKKARYLNMKAPISGLIVSVKVKVGEEIRAGQELVVLEAMKMENVLVAEYDVKIKQVKVKAGDSIATGDVMIEFE